MRRVLSSSLTRLQSVVDLGDEKTKSEWNEPTKTGSRRSSAKTTKARTVYFHLDACVPEHFIISVTTEKGIRGKVALEKKRIILWSNGVSYKFPNKFQRVPLPLAFLKHSLASSWLKFQWNFHFKLKLSFHSKSDKEYLRKLDSRQTWFSMTLRLFNV